MKTRLVIESPEHGCCYSANVAERDEKGDWKENVADFGREEDAKLFIAAKQTLPEVLALHPDLRIRVDAKTKEFVLTGDGIIRRDKTLHDLFEKFAKEVR